MKLHCDVIDWVLSILKQDDYFRALEELPPFNELNAYYEIELFPELFDTVAVVERITCEADERERQLKR